MLKNLYGNALIFSVAATVVILIGSIVTMAYPLARDDMHPKLETLKPYTALQLAGRDIYQREGCVNCHTQVIRPLRSEVARYGEYSKAGEFAYERPFLWGSKRTGPDLAREGGKRPDAWHVRHFEDPAVMIPRSNMPPYPWLKLNKLDPNEIESHMKALDFPYSAEEIAALTDKTELDAMVAYMQVLGTAVPRRGSQEAAAVNLPVGDNPMRGNAEAIAKGKEVYDEYCEECHGDHATGDIAPSLVDEQFIGKTPDLGDDAYFKLIYAGSDGGAIEGRTPEDGMPDFGSDLSTDEIWSVISYVRSLPKGGSDDDDDHDDGDDDDDDDDHDDDDDEHHDDDHGEHE